MSLEIIILAAGQGTRMKSDLPKVLHSIGHLPLLEHVHRLGASFLPEKISIIYGHGGDQVLSRLAHLDAIWVEQKERLGTGHAVMQLAEDIGEHSTVLILYGDVPLLKQETVRELLALTRDGSLGLLTVQLEDPHGYGRIIRDGAGQVLRIVEEKDATAEEKGVREGNTGILAMNGGQLRQWLQRLTNDNAQGEYYLTDVIGLAVDDGISVKTVQASSVDEVLGVNNRQQLAHLERIYQMGWANKLMLQGVTLRDPARFDVRGEIESLGQDVEIDVNVVLEGRVRLGDRVRVGPNTVIRDSEIGDDVQIMANTVVDNAIVGAGCRIGPFARLRPETELGEDVHVGNFVEIKKSIVGNHSKINHLSYVGDARVGSDVNIGAGAITCNYDGANKFQTIIADGAFIGSDSQLVAPVRVGKNATIGAGSTVTRDAPADALTVSRVKQVTREGWQRPTKKQEG
ncbi:MAG: bifunctional UDP-N-acetylglucosamine diphosphorylase/glucosamine-1-phosphate N-acetyltransferase GlmU [Methylococcus sp.]